MISQDDAILKALQAGRVITPMDALRDFGCMRLAARIADIKKAKFDILDEFVEFNGKRFKKYWIHRPAAHGDMFMDPESEKQHEFSRK